MVYYLYISVLFLLHIYILSLSLSLSRCFFLSATYTRVWFNMSRYKCCIDVIIHIIYITHTHSAGKVEPRSSAAARVQYILYIMYIIHLTYTYSFGGGSGVTFLPGCCCCCRCRCRRADERIKHIPVVATTKTSTTVSMKFVGDNWSCQIMVQQPLCVHNTLYYI